MVNAFSLVHADVGNSEKSALRASSGITCEPVNGKTMVTYGKSEHFVEIDIDITNEVAKYMRYYLRLNFVTAGDKAICKCFCTILRRDEFVLWYKRVGKHRIKYRLRQHQCS
jgi:hypothetical protein